MDGIHIHKRRSSKDLEQEDFIVPALPNSAVHTPSIVLAPAPPENHISQPGRHSRSTSIAGAPMFNPRPASVGPYQTTFHDLPNGQPMNGVDGSNMPPMSIPTLKPTPGYNHHHRFRSVSGPFLPSQRSPLVSSFANADVPPSLSSPSINTTPPFPVQLTSSQSLPREDLHTVTLNNPPSSTSPTQNHSHRHARLHSRNLSIFFPRPGSLPTCSIAEDGSQEVELKADIEAPVTTIPSAGSSVQFPRSVSHGHAPPTPLGAGFSFGGRPPAMSSPSRPLMDSLSSSSSTSSMGMMTKSRRGHHHKHSVSHSFFSFLEPGSTGVVGSNGMPLSPATPSELVHAQPPSASVPVSPWTPRPTPSSRHQSVYETESREKVVFRPAVSVVVLGQFLLGAWLWVCGQRIGSLSCTGIGYWIVFDSFGIGVAKVLPGWLNSKDELTMANMNTRERERKVLKRPYGCVLIFWFDKILIMWPCSNKRVMTVFMFAQAVYLLFSAVYVCKETIEHILLAAGDGHHHHPGEDDSWIG